jgi:hypothetical protein
VLCWWRWRCIGLCSWLNRLSVVYGVSYLQWWQRVGDGRLSGMALACGRSVVVWLVVWRRVSMVIGLVL